jgi:hypothetical protein
LLRRSIHEGSNATSILSNQQHPILATAVLLQLVSSSSSAFTPNSTWLSLPNCALATQAEVSNLNNAVLIDEAVARLDVAMN